MASILVTGGAVYIGSVLAPQLLENRHSVTVIDSFIYRQNSLLECCKYENFEINNIDCRDKKARESS